MKARTATREEMRYATRRWHYTGKTPSSAFGYSYFTDGGGFMGVVLFSCGANRNIGKEYGLFMGEALELVRVALNGEQGHGRTSEVIADALHRLKRDRKNARLVVSYADADQNHLGTIYQATNWIYVGTRNEGALANIYVDGERVHHRLATEGKLLTEFLEEKKAQGHEVRVDRTRGKRKYLMPLDRKMRKRVVKLAQPYPKAGE